MTTWKKHLLSAAGLIVRENFQLKIDIDVYNKMKT